MRLSGRRESNHVEDRRGMGAGAKAGIGGIGGVILIALLTLLGGGDLGDVVNNVVTQEMQQSRMTEAQAPNQREFTEEEQELAKFSRQILAGTEDVWTEEFKKMGRQYVPPTLVLFTTVCRVPVEAQLRRWGLSIVRPTKSSISTCPSFRR